MTCLIQKTFAIKSRSHQKTNKSKNILASSFLQRDDLDFLQQIVSAIYRALFGKVWLSSVC